MRPSKRSKGKKPKHRASGDWTKHAHKLLSEPFKEDSFKDALKVINTVLSVANKLTRAEFTAIGAILNSHADEATYWREKYEGLANHVADR